MKIKMSQKNSPSIVMAIMQNFRDNEKKKIAKFVMDYHCVRPYIHIFMVQLFCIVFLQMND